MFTPGDVCAEFLIEGGDFFRGDALQPGVVGGAALAGDDVGDECFGFFVFRGFGRDDAVAVDRAGGEDAFAVTAIVSGNGGGVWFAKVGENLPDGGEQDFALGRLVVYRTEGQCIAVVEQVANVF